MEAYLGQIIQFAGNFAPVGWAKCDGSKLVINDNQALYAVLGTTYGGDGVTNFGLPDLRGRLPLGEGKGTATDATAHAVGQSGGTETVTLTVPQIPAHTHGLNASTASATSNVPTGKVLATVGAKTVAYFNPPPPSGVTVAPAPLGAASITPSGNGQLHANLMPSMGIMFLICTSGLFPTPA